MIVSVHVVPWTVASVHETGAVALNDVTWMELSDEQRKALLEEWRVMAPKTSLQGRRQWLAAALCALPRPRRARRGL